MKKAKAPKSARARAKQGAPRNRVNTGLHSKAKSLRASKPKGV